MAKTVQERKLEQLDEVGGKLIAICIDWDDDDYALVGHVGLALQRIARHEHESEKFVGEVLMEKIQTQTVQPLIDRLEAAVQRSSAFAVPEDDAS